MTTFDVRENLSYGAPEPVVSKRVFRRGFSSRMLKPLLYGRNSFPSSDANLRFRNRPENICFSVISNVTCFPNNIFISDGREVLPQSFLRRRTSVHGGLEYDCETDKYRLRMPSKEEATAIRDEYVVSIDTDRPSVYGHVLLESFSKLWALDHLKSKIPFRVITASNPGGRYSAVFDLFGISRDRLIHLDAPIRCKNIIVPDITFNRRQWIHPKFFEIMDRIKSLSTYSEITPPERIYVSRSKIPGRKLLNEREIEYRLKEKGYTIIHPQDFSFIDQIKIFSSAREIVAVGGSGAHNAVFANSNCRILILSSSGWFVNADILLNRERGRLGYCFGDPLHVETTHHRTQADWRIALSDVDTAHRQHFGRY